MNTAPPEAAAIRTRAPRSISMSAALTLLAFLAAVLMLQYAQAMIIPIVLGVLISYALEPAVNLLARLHLPRALGAAIVLLAVVTA